MKFVTPTSSTLNDDIITSLKNDSFDSGIIFSVIADPDHLAIFHIRPIQMNISKSNTTIINIRKRNKRNTERFKESISNTDWIPINSDNPSTAFIEFYCILDAKFAEHFPEVTCKVRKDLNPLNPFMTGALLVSRKHKNKLAPKKKISLG